MNENERKTLKKEIGKLILKINKSRKEAPNPELKELRKSLRKTRKKILTIGKNELKDRLETAFLKLSNVESQNKNLVKAQKHAFELWRNFPHYLDNLKTGAPMRK